MNEVVFITDADTPLGCELVNVYLNNGYSIFGTVSHADGAKKKVESMYESFDAFKDNVKFEIWNRKSPASSKSILLQALTAYKEINKVFILGNPVSINLKLVDVNYKNIELNIDSFVKGNIFLVKEIIKYYREKNNPPETDIIALINITNNKPVLLIDEIVKSSFSGIIRSLLEINKNDGMNICGFESKSEKYEEFVNYIYRLIENKAKRISGRLLKFTSGIMPRIIR